MSNPQFDSRRRLRHVLTTEGWSRALLTQVLDRIDAIAQADRAGSLPHHASLHGVLRDTATDVACRIVFAPLAQSGPAHDALRLAAVWGGWTLHQVPSHALTSFDSPADVLARVSQTDPAADVLVIAHPASGMGYALAAVAPPHLKIVNVLDGAHAAPLAALAELAILRRRLPDLHTRVLSLSGDLVGDARLRAFIHMLTTLGVPRVNVVHAGAHVPVGASQLGVHVVPAGEQEAARVGVDALIGFPVPPDLGQAVTLHGLPAEPDIDQAPWRDPGLTRSAPGLPGTHREQDGKGACDESDTRDTHGAHDRPVRTLASVFCAVILQLMAPT